MIVDSSSLIAILRDEPGADRLMDALSKATQPRISAGTLLEASIVVDAQATPVMAARRLTMSW